MSASFVPDWAAAAELRRAGLADTAIAPADWQRCWVYACLTGNRAELHKVRATLQHVWDHLPDLRLRRCGNGKLLQAFLAATGDLSAPDWPILLALPLPAPRQP